MNPDPFRALDRIDPPDHWDDISQRAGSDELDVDLDTIPSIRPRRRAALLVAAAAAVALVAGVAVAGGGDADDGVTADTTPTTVVDAGLGGPCPFVLDDPGLRTPVPMAVPADETDPLPLISDPQMDPASTWGRLRVDSTDLSIGVGTAVDADRPPSGVHIGGSSGGKQRPDGTRIEEPTVFVVGFTTIPDGGDCALVKVVVEVPLLPEDDQEQFVMADLDPAAYVEPVRPLLERVRASVTVLEADPADGETPATNPVTPDLGGPCPFTLVGPGIPAAQPHELEVTPDDLPGTESTAGLVTVDGVEVTVMLGGLPELGEPILGPVGTIEPVEAGPVDPATGTVRVAGHEVVSDEVPCTDLQAWATVPEGDADPAVAVVERVLAAVVTRAEELDAELEEATSVAERDEELSRQIAAEAREYQERLTALQEAAQEDEANAACAADPPCSEMTWEGPTDDGRTYRVEIDGDTTRAFVDDVLYGEAPQSTPSWTDPMRSAGLWFSNDGSTGTGDAFDAVIVGAVPPGAVESVVLDDDGSPIETPTLTFSPDGRFYAVLAEDLHRGDGLAPLGVRHRNADGDLFPVVPDHQSQGG